MDSSVLIVAGAQKSGSSSLAEWFLSSPQVSAYGRPECFAFEGHMPRLRTAMAHHHAEKAHLKNKITLIKRPEIFHNPGVLLAASQAFPDAEAVVVLRNPVQRAISAWLHYWRHGLIPTTSLRDCVSAWERDGTKDPLGQVIEYSLYADPASRFLAGFKRSTVLFDEEIQGGLMANLDSLIVRLGIENGLPPSLPRSNSRQFLAERAPRPSRVAGRIGYRWEAEYFTPRPSLQVSRLLRALIRATAQPIDDPLVTVEDREAVASAVIPNLPRLEHALNRHVPRSWQTA